MRLHQKRPDLAMNVPLQNGQSPPQETEDGVIECRKTWFCTHAHVLPMGLRRVSSLVISHRKSRANIPELEKPGPR